MPEVATEIMERLDALGLLTDEPGRLTRTFCSDAMRRATSLVQQWMKEAGMSTWVDPIGNVLGRYEGLQPGAKTLLLGSHLDTVRDAGKYDGPLGVVLAIALVNSLHKNQQRLPFAIEVIGFADEEGVRYQSTYLGSRVLAGTFDPGDLDRSDSLGIQMREAIRAFGGNPERLSEGRRDPKQILGYVEVHIEQGPILEQQNLSVGVVTAIAGQTRARLNFTGKAGHAGTTPMHLRQDALCAAAEFVLAAEALAFERSGLVATVGQLEVLPGASNVIPASANLCLDVRHPIDEARRAAVTTLRSTAERIAAERKMELNWQTVQETAAVSCDQKLTAALDRAVGAGQQRSILLSSGAGHDAAAIAALSPISMLFVRCKNGLSHHPEESVRAEDVQVAFETMRALLAHLAKEHGS